MSRRAIVLASWLVTLWAGSGAALAGNAGFDLADFDPTVRPQDDFYRYVNGGWLARTAIPEDLARWSNHLALGERAREEVRAILEEPATAPGAATPDAVKLRTFYSAFMDEARVEALRATPVAAAFRRIDRLRTAADVAAEFARLDRAGVSSPLEFAVHPDNRDSAHYIFDTFQSGLGLPDRDYYLGHEERLVAVRTAYRAYAADLLRRAGVDRPDAAADAVVDLETTLASAQWPAVEDRDPVKTYNKRPVATLAGDGSRFDWVAFLKAAGVAGRVTSLTVSEPSYVRALGDLTHSVPVGTWRLYCKWRVLNNAAPYLSRDFVNAQFGFYGTTLRDVPANEPRWRRASQATEAALGEAIGRRYAERTFQAEARARAEAIIGNLLAEYRRSLESVTWLGPDTKAEALAKLAALRVKVGAPSRWRDYSALRIERGDLYGNIVRAHEFATDQGIARLGREVDREEWSTLPQTVNAFYDFERNELIMPAAYLQPPFFQPAADDAVNYGAIGAIIGHEISHAFDDRGAQFDGAGNLRNWWTEADLAEFRQRAAALTDQYSRYEVIPGYFVNGAQTVGENIADTLGLEIAAKAYRRSLAGNPAPEILGFSGEQRVYIGYAQAWRRKVRDGEAIRLIKIDPHAPNEFRVNGALVNQDGFVAAFAVKPSDRMYIAPERRVHLW